MGQVPEYIIIGDGRMARHFSHYLSLLQIPFRRWARSQDMPLVDAVKDCSRVLLLISDSAIEPFIAENVCLYDKHLLHFSGQLVTDKAISTHPLMSFGLELYTLADYQKVPWAVEAGASDFPELLPGLSNPYFYVPKDKKSYYHAICVMANNFTTLLWTKFFNEMKDQFDVPKENLLPYLQRTMQNLSGDHEAALTGPLIRGDQKTIKKNLASLEGDDYAVVYRAFVEAFGG